MWRWLWLPGNNFWTLGYKANCILSNSRDRASLTYELNCDRNHQIDEIDHGLNMYCTLYDSSLPSYDYLLGTATMLCVLVMALQWRHNGRNIVSHRPSHDWLLNRLFRRRSKKTSKLRVIGLCAGNSPGNDDSPNPALICLVDNISNALEECEYVLGLFSDFSKAFDTIHHQIRLKNMEYYRAHGIAHTSIKSYLSNRKQYVEYNSCKELSWGVPQGPILGPRLFLIYSNYLANVSQKLFFLVVRQWFEYLLISSKKIRSIDFRNELRNRSYHWLVGR